MASISAARKILMGVLLCLMLSLISWKDGEGNMTHSRYFVDSEAGDDHQDGRSPGTAWQSLTKVNSTVFQPGDHILFKAGSIWTGELKPQGSGIAGKPIVINRYGEGDKPLIQGAGAPSAVSLYNQEYWEIGHLELTNTGPTATSYRRGVSIIGEDYEASNKGTLDEVSTLHHIRLHDLYIHDVNGEDRKDGLGSAGILIAVLITDPQDKASPSADAVHERTTFDQIVIENNVIERVERSGIATWSDWKNRELLHDQNGCADCERAPWTPLTNVVIRGNKLTHIGGDGIVPHMTDRALVESNTLKGFNMTSTGYNAGMWTWNGDHTLYQFNEVSEGYSTRDGMAFDFDHASDGIIYQYNYSHDNDGGTLLFCSDGSGGKVTNGIFRYNISQNDKYQIFTICGASNVYNMQVYNNVFYIGPDLDTHPLVSQGGAVQVTLHNNIFFNLGSGHYTGKASWTYDSNLYYGNHIPSMSTIPDPNRLTSDPLFIEPGAAADIHDLSGYKLRIGSPAIGSGINMPTEGMNDLFGDKIVSSNLGAYGGLGEAAKDQADNE
ncbi:hypothetical protein [Paenibacillus aquistagni]|uniref:Right handed beta helix region n=1 Tax=Paenibacillus aquistagni TaxID=1852522 RepID=A0A1X7J3W7_9BACL|nr:hypothetical protein [Paenibacillus aquistagni]SMG22280.1 Right handed beta helix region [Paenibacillus aquistagni]